MDNERDMLVFSYCTKGVDLESFYDIVINGKKIENASELKNWERGYFAMSMLLPKNKFLDIVRLYGGIDDILINDTSLVLIADKFKVDERMVVARLMDLVKRDLTVRDEDVKNNQKTKKIKLFSKKK